MSPQARSRKQAEFQKPNKVRCAIYTRKSTEEGLEQEFNSLDAQREAAEAFIQSQKHEGWVGLPERYDDGGFSGGSMDRPALRQLLGDVEAGKVDAVVVYKVDRLSRSLLDFARIMDVLDRHGASFVSITQQFNTTTSMGRLTLNVLLSFAQFEREIIAERTRDKMSAARRKGKWVGGTPVLGYDVDPRGGRLIVNEAEAEAVRTIFKVYLEHGSLLETAREVNRRGIGTKRWTTKAGRVRTGRPMTRADLHRLLHNLTYIGRVRHRGSVYPGEHEAIIDMDTWDRVEALLGRNGGAGGCAVRNKHGALLAGLLWCVSCGARMTPTYTRKRDRRYRYYLCRHAQAQGWDSCPTKSLPAGEIERFVVERLRALGSDAKFRARVLAKVRADLATRSDAFGREDLKEGEVIRALQAIDAQWEKLAPREQARIVQLLIDRVAYDGEKETVTITFRSAGLRTLAREGQA